MENPYVSWIMTGLKRALRFIRNWRSEERRYRETELTVLRSDRPVEATLYLPDSFSSPLPGWIVLHGLTRPGRRHPAILRFVRALAGSGAAVLVPEIPEWRELYLAMEEAADTIRGSVFALAERKEAAPGRIGVMGFSMGVPPVLFSGTDTSLKEHLRAVAGFGGFCDLERTLLYLFTGRHEWKGKVYHGDPDHYGRWIAGGNYLSKIPEFEEAQDVADALLALSREAGDLREGSWTAVYDSRKDELLEDIHPTRHDLFRAFAPPAGETPSEGMGKVLAPALARAAYASTPLSQPATFLDRLYVPTRLIHGRGDRLIPFSESLRLEEGFPAGADVKARLTGLFSHSQEEATRAGGGFKEQVHFVRILADLLGLI